MNVLVLCGGIYEFCVCVRVHARTSGCNDLSVTHLGANLISMEPVLLYN